MAQVFARTYREVEWRAVYSGSLRRSITTAQPLCDAVGINLQVRAELNEIAYGKWEGLTKEKVSQEYHDEYISWLADPGLACTNGRRIGDCNCAAWLTSDREDPEAVNRWECVDSLT